MLQEQPALYATVEAAAAEMIKVIEAKANKDGPVELGHAADDHEARQLGWPCVGAQRAALGLVMARLSGYRFRLVPRGSTVASAAAIEAHLT